MTKSKRIEKKANKATQVEESKPEVVVSTYDALLAKALGKTVAEVIKNNLPSEEEKVTRDAEIKETLKQIRNTPTPPSKASTKVLDPEEVVEEIVDDLERGEEDDLEIIEIPVVKGKKVISQNSAQAQKLLIKKANNIAIEEIEKVKMANPKDKEKAIQSAAKVIAQAVINIAPVKKKVNEMTEKERKTYYANLSKKALAAKQAKADAKLISEGRIAEISVVASAVVSKRTRTTAIAPKPNPLSGRVIPEGTTGSELKSLLKAEKKAAGTTKKSIVTIARTTPLSKMTIAELESIKGTITDVQWNKYFKMAGGISGIAKKEIKVVAPVVSKSIRTVLPNKVEPKAEVKVAPKAEPKRLPIITLSDFTLDELIAELKNRGCKGSIRVCTEVEL